MRRRSGGASGIHRPWHVRWTGTGPRPDGRRAVRPRTDGSRPPTAGELVARGVCAWFGGRLVLEDVNLDMERLEVTALIGPSGCGKSTFLRILNRMHEVVPGRAAGRVGRAGRRRHLRARPAGQRGAAPHRHGVPAAQPVSRHVDLRQRARRVCASPGPRCADRDGLVEESLTRAGLWNEVRNRLQGPRRRPLRRPAAAPLHRPRPGGQAEGAAHGRALLGPRPYLHASDRADDRGDRRRRHRRHRHAQHAAGPARLAHLRLLPGRREPARPHRRERAPPRPSSADPNDPRTADYVHGRFG